jgi:alpha-tubulin suppressor-like RCC1 family protein
MSRIGREHLLYAACGGVFVLFLQQLASYIRPQIEGEVSQKSSQKRNGSDRKIDENNKPESKPSNQASSSSPKTGYAEKFVKDFEKSNTKIEPLSNQFDEVKAFKQTVSDKNQGLPDLDLSHHEDVFSLNLKSDDCNLIGFGNNEDGQLSPQIGKSSTIDPGNEPGLSPRIVAQNSGFEERVPETFAYPSPVKHIGAAHVIVGVSCGSRHTLAVTAEGLVFAWGWAALGQLGLPPPQTRPRGGSINSYGRRGPVEEPASPPIENNSMIKPIEALATARAHEGKCVEVAAGGMHSAARFESGHVYTWGMSTFGQLGRGVGVAEARSVATPGVVTMEDGQPLVAMQISCGGMHTAAVALKGELYAWGRADSGQLGIGKKWLGSMNQGGNDSKGVCYPTRVSTFKPSDDPVAQVSCGAFHTMAVTSSGLLYSWGREEFGCLGIYFTGDRLVSGVYKPQKVELPSGVSRIVSVSCGGAHTLALDSQGKVLCCGKNEAGRLGLGDSNANRITFEILKSFTDAKIKIESCAAGGSHSLFLSKEGDLYSCGRATLGRLGVGPNPNCAKKEGMNSPVLMIDHNTTNFTSTTENSKNKNKVISFAAGGQHSCVVFA